MKINKLIIAWLMGLSLLVSSCTNGFDDLNVNPDGQLSEGFFDAPNYISSTILYAGNMNFMQENNALSGGAHLQERIKVLQIDGFAQYNTGAYSPNPAWARDYWGAQYITYLKTLNAALEGADLFEDAPNLKGYGLIWRTFIQANFIDYFGPAPYPTESTDEKPEFKGVKEQHEQFFQDLDKGIASFDNTVKILKEETLYEGDIIKWKRFANSLRLRLAIKISEIDPTLSQTEITKAINGSEGLLQQGDDATSKPYALWGNTYPYSVLTWSKNKLSTTMAKTLTNIGGAATVIPKGVDKDSVQVYPAKLDPRALTMYDFSEKYVVKNNDKNEYWRSWKGMNPAMANAGGYGSTVSNMNKVNYLDNTNRPIELLTYSEVCFLMAEACERGFATGSAKSWYDKGVNESFRKAGKAAEATAYLASTEKNEWGASAKYGDDTGAAGNSNLEKIVTQRYISHYPDLALQVWNDKRRLNLPAMDIFEVREAGVANWPTDKDIHNPLNYVQRMPFPSSEVGLNSDRYLKSIDILNSEANGHGDGDRVLTPLWWASKLKNYSTAAK